VGVQGAMPVIGWLSYAVVALIGGLGLRLRRWRWYRAMREAHERRMDEAEPEPEWSVDDGETVAAAAVPGTTHEFLGLPPTGPVTIYVEEEIE
jgi:hypothetical protein